MFKSTSVSILFLLVTLSTLAFTLPIQPRDVDKFKEDLGVLSRGIFDLSYAVSSIGNTITPQQALTIYGQGSQVQREIDTCNGNAKDIHSVSNANAKDVLNVVKGFTPIIVGTLDTIGVKKKVFEKYSYTIPLIRNQLAALHSGATELGDTLIALVPPDSRRETIRLKNQINEAFNKAINIYS